jgi:phosphoglycerate dehydrogenase-like enzyme
LKGQDPAVVRLAMKRRDGLDEHRPTGNPAVLYMPVDGVDIGPGEELLRSHGLRVLHWADGPAGDELSDVIALLTGYDPIRSGLLDRMPALRLVATHSAGYDMVDVAAVSARRLWLANLPGAATEEVATHALAMALAVLRRLADYDHDVREGRWFNEQAPLPQIPGELTCGVVGLGQIGRAFAQKARGLFGRVIGFDPQATFWPASVERFAELDDLLAASHCVSLHVPLTPGTHGLIDARRLGLLPRGAVLVNVSRGSLVDEDALREALADGQLGGAALDVLTEEPIQSGNPLLATPGVLLSPHVAFLSASALRRYAEIPARNVLALLDSGAPLTPVMRPCDAAEGSAL